MSHVRQKGATLVGSSPAVYIKDEYQWFAFSLKWNNWNGFILGQALMEGAEQEALINS